MARVIEHGENYRRRRSQLSVNKITTPEQSIRIVGAAGTVVAGTLSLLTVAATESDAIRPFHVFSLEAQLVDLAGTAATRWPGKETVADKSLGVRLATVEQLGRYRQTGYDWRKAAIEEIAR